MSLLLNVADVRLRSRVNGPGIRSVVWTQGCSIGCPQCCNPHTHDHEPKRLIDPERLALDLLDVDVDGLTISGGEPFEQAEACAILAATYRRTGRSVVVFSGYRYERLRSSHDTAVSRFLESIDLLIAGPYVAGLADNVSHWRGSRNQTVHVLTDRIAGLEECEVEPMVEVTIRGTEAIASGFPTDQDRRWLQDCLEAGPKTITHVTGVKP